MRIGDLVQLERLAQQFATRDQFLAELALDPPAATGDLAGTPYLDEDYLVLSTVHSAKGQEWDAVYMLNVADGNFPSEFSTGRSDQIEEERRLLYVAMTRAKNDLHLIAPLKYYVTNQPKTRRPPRVRRAKPVPDRRGHGQAQSPHVAGGERWGDRRRPGPISRERRGKTPQHVVDR